MSGADAKRSRPIGRYHMLDRVGRGGMAEVYRAKRFEPDGTEHLVALKKVLDTYAADPGFLKMLVAEYHLSALFDHPNVAAIYELLMVPEGYFIAMEYCDGKDLRGTMIRARQQRRRFEFADMAYVMARALDGLHYAHTATTADGAALNLVHRDFTPSNILVGYDGSVKVIDFGIAKASVPRERTAAGVIKGKVRYMSPEQANGDERLTGQSDVFGAGSILYELLSGEPAFSASSEVELILAVRGASPRPLAQLAPHTPAALIDIVKRAMARSRGDRYATAAEFRDALVDFLRAYAPGYRHNRLAKLMKQLWAREIDEEIAAMLEYAISAEPPVEAVNLLAGASMDESLRAAIEFAESTAPAPSAGRRHAARVADPPLPIVQNDDDETTVPARGRRRER